jgi:hypothetical protein
MTDTKLTPDEQDIVKCTTCGHETVFFDRDSYLAESHSCNEVLRLRREEMERELTALREELKRIHEAEMPEPVAWAAAIDGEIQWDADYPFSNEPFSCFDDEQAMPLYGPELLACAQRMSKEASDAVHLNDEQARRVFAAEEKVQRMVELLKYYADEYRIAEDSGELQHWPENEARRCKAIAELLKEFEQ